MRTRRILPAGLVFSLLLASALACNLPGSGNADLAITQTLEAVGTIAALTQQAAQPGSGPAAEGTPSPEVTVQSPPTPTPTLAHAMRPGEPGSIQSFITDYSTRLLGPERRAIGDNYDFLEFERPFTAQEMVYQPHLDLVRAELSAVSPWLYILIAVEEPPPAGETPTYAVEFDLDIDGRGDWLITATLPLTTTWSVEGVRVYRDGNNDVGWTRPLRSDVAPPSPTPHPSDGYDVLVVDQGYGLDADAAWARLDPSNPRRVQIALKHSLIDNDAYMLWGVWADGGLADPARFYYHDHFSLAEAGSPQIASPHYPLQAVASLDNTCRWTYHFTPTENLPGMCPLPPTPTPVLPGTITGRVFLDQNHNNSYGPGDSVYAGTTVTLRSGGCSGSVVATTTTNASGIYQFTGVIPGAYCVSVSIAAGDPGTCPCGGLCMMSSYQNPRTTTVSPGGTATLDFGFQMFGPC